MQALARQRARDDTYLVHIVLLTQFVKLRVHGVQHGHHLHRRDAAADGGEADDVAEEDGHALEHLHTLLPCFNFFSLSKANDIVAQTTLY